MKSSPCYTYFYMLTFPGFLFFLQSSSLCRLLLLLFFFLNAVAITFISAFCFFCFTLQYNYFSMLLCRPHNQVHGLYNSLVRCMIVYLNLAIGHLSHMVLLKMEWATLLVGVWNGTTLLGKQFGSMYHRPKKHSLP